MRQRVLAPYQVDVRYCVDAVCEGRYDDKRYHVATPRERGVAFSDALRVQEYPIG